MCNGNCDQGRTCDCPKPRMTRAEAWAVLAIYLLSGLATASVIGIVIDRIAP